MSIIKITKDTKKVQNIQTPEKKKNIYKSKFEKKQVNNYSEITMFSNNIGGANLKLDCLKAELKKDQLTDL